jgi:hypothetical protein
MKRLLISAALLGALSAPASAALISVESLGSILNQSLALPAEDTPGSGISFAEFFEFSLPTKETVTLSMSDSAIGTQKISGGALSLNDWTSTGPGPLFIPAGALIESSPIVNFIGGQSATVVPDVLAAGNYFAEVSGVSGSSPIHISVDGTITAVTGVGATVPEPSTWVMLALGFGAMAWAAATRRRGRPFTEETA